MTMRALLLAAITLLAGCGELPGEVEREECPSPGFVRSAPLQPVAATAQPPPEALAALSSAFGVAAIEGEPEVIHGSEGEAWMWRDGHRTAVATAVADTAVHVDLRVNGTRFEFDAAAAQEALAGAAATFDVPGHVEADRGGFRFTWQTGISSPLQIEESRGRAQTLYTLKPAYLVPGDALPSSVYGSIPARAVVCTLAQAGAFLGASGAALHEERFALDDQNRLEKRFVYRLHDAACEREVHVRFDARSGNLLGTHLQPCPTP